MTKTATRPTFVPRAEQWECTIIVRGSMHQAMFTSERAFEDWLEREGRARKGWKHMGGTPYSECLIYVPDGTVNQRATAHKISHLGHD